MAGVEPYSPCPCGSGQKFKWCCHKVEAFADKAQRLVEGGQAEAALKVLDEGLKKEPGNPWLLTRKAIIQIRLGTPEPAKGTLRLVLQKNPNHFGALILLTRCILETEGPVNGAGMFQEVLKRVDPGLRPQLAGLARVVGLLLASAQHYPAALQHLDLVRRLGDPEQAVDSPIRSIMTNPAISPWLKDRQELAPAPAQLSDADRSRFETALADASIGLWASAAGGFDALASHDPGGEADYNLGICRLWLGDEFGAVAPLRRRSRRLGDSAEAVDLEVLAQLIEPIHPDDKVEHVQLTWPLRNREKLIETLRAKSDIIEDGTGPIDLDDPESPLVETFAFLDRPALDDLHDGRGLTPEQIPLILGRVSIGQEIVALETYDDGRVDSLGDRFTAVAGSAIAPAHPRTKVLGETNRSILALGWEWLTPEGMDPAETNRLDLAQRARVIRDLWPVTPVPYLGLRTPEQAAKDGHYAIPLRAALCQFEQHTALVASGLDFVALRARLKIPAEPAIDPASVDIGRLPLGRLANVPVAALDDDRLIRFYQRTRLVMMAGPMEAAALEIVGRPGLLEKGQVDSVTLHTDLASLAASRGENPEAFAWLAKGRQADSPVRRAPNAPLWDMIEARLKARSEPPEVWVPELAIILERYSQEKWANQIILMNLVEMGLVRLSPNPDNPDDVLIDSRPLQAVLAEYGPRVTTSSGRLGVSATKPDLWTPGGPAGGAGGALWTPGSGSGQPPSGDKPKLIIPGR